MALSSASLAVTLLTRLTRAYEDRTISPEFNVQLSTAFSEGDAAGEVEMVCVVEATASTDDSGLVFQEVAQYPLDASDSPTQIDEVRVILIQNLGEQTIVWTPTSMFGASDGFTVGAIQVPPGGFSVFYSGTGENGWAFDEGGNIIVTTESGTSAYRIWFLGMLATV